MKDERFDLEGELHAGRSEPRSEFVTSLAGDVRGRVRRVRVGLWLALAGLVVVAVASFGGIGTAATTKHNATSASAQYTSGVSGGAVPRGGGRSEGTRWRPARRLVSSQMRPYACAGGELGRFNGLHPI